MKLKLSDKGFLYFKDRYGPLKTHWRCADYQKPVYPRARISVLQDGTKERKGEHPNHIVNLAKNEAVGILSQICEKVQILYDV